MKQYQLPKEFATKWVVALRSGKYKQAQSRLCDGTGYCCLGVAGSISGIRNEVMSDEGFLGWVVNPLIHDIPSLLITKSDDTEFIQEVTSMNDKGVSFLEIADWIEQNVEFI